jgi:AraC-like DNA-binding protein
MAFVRAVLLAFHRYGVSPQSALRAANIATRTLSSTRLCITSQQMETLCAAAMQELDDEALGWFSRRFPWGTYGMLCRASVPSPTLGVALKRWCRHHRLLTDDLTPVLHAAGSTVAVTLGEARDFGAMRELCLVSSLRYLHGFACWAVDSRIPLRAASFPYAQPAHAAVYSLLFPCRIEFEAAQAAIQFDTAYLDLPLCRDEAALRRMLQQALPLTVRPYRHDRLLQHSVRAQLRAHPDGLRNAAAVAAALQISVRSLHRQLRKEGRSLQSLRNEVRCAEAQELLRRTAQPIKRIAHAVGFKSEKSFSRAFRSWTGWMPRDARRQPT